MTGSAVVTCCSIASWVEYGVGQPARRRHGARSTRRFDRAPDVSTHAERDVQRATDYAAAEKRP
jgi:hypothetical protein